jgi:hypothetical protein
MEPQPEPAEEAEPPVDAGQDDSSLKRRGTSRTPCLLRCALFPRAFIEPM